MKLKRLLALGLAAVMSLSILAGCSGSSSTPEPRDEKITATVTVWGPQEDQSEENGKWLQTQCEAFAAAHPDWTLTFNYGVCSEGDAKTNVGTDPSAAADVYMFANDQIPDLLKAEALAELGGKTAEDIKANNSATTVNTVTYNGGIYGVPFTANTWFMYYDKSAFTEEDILSMEAMLQKGKVAFPLSNSWYMAAMYVANGCTLFGEDGGDADAGIDFGGDKAVAVTNYLVDLVANPNFVNGDVSSTTDVKAFFSGTWDYQKAVEAYGDNLGIAPAPYISIDGEVKQMKAFAGSKAIGVNPQSALYAEHPEVAVALAAWLGSTDAQNSQYASIVQPLQDKMGQYWTPAQSMGEELVAGTVTHANAAEKTEAMNTAMNTGSVR